MKTEQTQPPAGLKHWKPKGFTPDWPLPEEGCAFVLGGSLHGEIMQAQPLPRYFRRAAAVHELSATMETYRLEKFICGANQRSLWFYIYETDDTGFLLGKAFTELCMFLREARETSVPCSALADLCKSLTEHKDRYDGYKLQYEREGNIGRAARYGDVADAYEHCIAQIEALMSKLNASDQTRRAHAERFRLALVKITKVNKGNPVLTYQEMERIAHEALNVKPNDQALAQPERNQTPTP